MESIPSQKKKVLTFGELLIRLSPERNGGRLEKNSIPIYAGGAEANVSTALALWGIPVSYLTAVPDHLISKQMLAHLSAKNIELTSVIYIGERLGLYFLPAGGQLKDSGVVYDRNNSSFSQLKTGMIDWEFILKDIAWFHFSAISPALNSSIAEVCLEALLVAAQMNIKISTDLNYRPQLWQFGIPAFNVMPELVKYCDVVMGNIWSASKLLNIPLEYNPLPGSSNDIYLEQAERTSKIIMEKFPKCSAVANTFRLDDLSELRYFSALFTSEDGLLVSSEYTGGQGVDKVGSGDCYMAGLIFGFYHNLSGKQIVDFATAAAYRKLFIEGDTTTMTVNEINSYVLTNET